MAQQDFIYTPGIWLGEGKITFNSTSDSIKFFTKWQIQKEDLGVIQAVQVVEMEGIEVQTINRFSFYDFTEETFSLSLENILIGKVFGKGFSKDDSIRWDFPHTPSFEGLEMYERQLNGEYVLHAEYGSEVLFKTIIDGVIWRAAIS